MSKKEELAEQYRRKAYEDSPNRKRCKYNSELIQWNNEIVEAFEVGWDAACEEIKAEIAWRRNESTLAEYNEALDDISSFIDSLKAKRKEE